MRNLKISKKRSRSLRKANEKLEDLKQIDIKSEAKKIGDRAYQAAKGFLNVIKKDKKED